MPNKVLINIQWITMAHKWLLFVVAIIYNLFLASYAIPYINIDKQIPMEVVYEQVYQTSCNMSEDSMNKFGYFGGYLAVDFTSSRKKICIEIEEEGEIERKMKESDIEISMNNPLKSAQYLWLIARLKFNIFILETECFVIWISVLKDLNLIDQSQVPEYLPEYNKIISYIPITPGKQISLRSYPNKDDLLIILSISTRIYKGGKFATDFTGGKILVSNEMKKNTTPLINSNIEYYFPIIMKLYPPSFNYQDLISSVSFVYRMIYYCTGRIIFPKEAWEIWGLIYSFGGGGYIPRYSDYYSEAILTQDHEDAFPEERNFFVTLERLIEMQEPPWDVLIPPIYNHRKEKVGGLEDHELFKFMETKGISIPNKDSKDIDGVIVIYFFFHYVLKLFISIVTARDLWIVLKNWLTHSTDYYISDKVYFVQSERHSTNRSLKYRKSERLKQIPKWATGNRYIDINSEILNNFIDEFENEFPYIVTCPNGDLALKDITSDFKYKYNPQKVQRTDRIAASIAKEIHTLFPQIKFRKICELASSFSLIVPFDIKLFSKFITKKKIGKCKNSKCKKEEQWKFEDNVQGIEYCRKGILSLLEEGQIELEQYNELDSIHIISYLDSACLRIIKSQLKCNIDTPYYFPYQVSNTINTFSGNIASALSSSFVGEKNYYKEVIGTMWDGKFQSILQEETLPSLFRLHNPGFNPESFCKTSEKFINPAIIHYFEKKKIIYMKKKRIKVRNTNFLSRIKERYYNKNKTCHSNMELFYSDLMVLKEIVNAHRVPRGANLDDWKEFVLDEESISSFILDQFRKPSDFNLHCKAMLERKIKIENIQILPISTNSNQYKDFLLERKRRTKSFFKTLVKDDNLDLSLKEISKLLIFKDESLLEFPETIASNFRDSILNDRLDLQFKNFAESYIDESCKKASSLIYKDTKVQDKKKSGCCCYSSCFNFLNKPEDSKCYVNESSKNYNKLVEEALELGLKIVMNNPNIKLNFTSYMGNSNLEVLEQSGITLTTNLVDKNFIINNASFIYIYLSSISVPISKDLALLTSEIASILLKNYHIHGEALINDKVTYLSSVNRDEAKVGEPSLFQITTDSNPLNFFQNYCKFNEYNERSLILLQKMSLSGNPKNSFNKTFLHWSNGYLSTNRACKIVQNLIQNGIITGKKFPENTKQAKNCLEFVSSEYPNLPHIPIPVCLSQELMVSCETGNNLDDVFASIILSHFPKFKTYDHFSFLRETVCTYSKSVSILYDNPRFAERCKDLFVEIFGFNGLMNDKFPILTSQEVESLTLDICESINLMHTCSSTNSSPLLTYEIKRVSDIIISEIKNEFSDFDFYWSKDAFCDTANEIIRSGIEECTKTLGKFLKTLDYEFPIEFEKTICSKTNIWPRACFREKFPNQSVFSNLFYTYIILPLIKDDLLKDLTSVNEISFYDACKVLENHYSEENYKSKNSEISMIGLDPTKVCTEFFENTFPKDEMYDQQVGLRIIEKKRECGPSISKMFVAIVKDEAKFSFFDNNLNSISQNFLYLPNYMQTGGIANTLINQYRLPPRVTLITIGLQHALNELNLKSKVKHEFSLLGLIYNSVKIVRRMDYLSEKDLLLDCVKINKDRIFPVIGDNELQEVCRYTFSSFENSELLENVYLLYSINNKVASYYCTHFTSENILLISRPYVSKVLQGKPSLAVQKVYEEVLNEYIDYMFSHFDSYLSDSKDENNGVSIYKRLGVVKINKTKGDSLKSNQEEKKENELTKFLNGSVYSTDVQGKHKDKLVKALIMFNFLMETKRLGVFQVHMNDRPYEISQEISSRSVLKFMPPDIANWLTSYENYKFSKMLFVVPIYSDGNKVIGPIANLDIENTILYEELSSKGIALNKVMNILENKQKLISGDRKIQISSTILETTIRYIINQYGNNEQIEYASSVINNSYVFRNAVRKLNLNKDIIYDIRKNVTPNTLIINKNFVAFEAIQYFMDNSPSELRSRTDFLINNFDFLRYIHKDSLFFYKGDINSAEMRNVRRRFFCQSFNRQIMRDADNDANPFFECYYFRTENGILHRESRHIEGKTVRYCEFTGMLTRTHTNKEEYLLHKKYLKFLINGDEYFYPFIGDRYRLGPEIIMRGIGRVYGYCLLKGEPLNFYFSNFILRYLKSGEPNNESNIKEYVDNRIRKFENMITLSFNTLDSKKFSDLTMDFKNAKKKVFNNQPIYYYIDQRRFENINGGPDLKYKHLGLFEVNNFNNLRFLRKAIANYIGFGKFSLEIENFFRGVYDIIPRRFLRSFYLSNLSHFSQGYMNTSLKSGLLFKSLITSYFYVENEDLLLPHKRNLIKWFHIALNSFAYTDIGFFFATFTNRFSIFPPTAYAGRIRIVEISLDEEKNPEKRIIIDPLLLVIYIPNYKTYMDVENGISKIIETNKKKFLYSA
ncbi:large with signal peptide [Cryptosporidium sp. chipmunk genotype I]|uniref:large with signal peptide n=1 Tax=Cryptosporidium sp. chipmunk genotype I TaxID=1280935 RepID=UPI00351A6046|nr:large with signal peptide [Cryptosporidium sp. chipmunk genotype I]